EPARRPLKSERPQLGTLWTVSSEFSGREPTVSIVGQHASPRNRRLCRAGPAPRALTLDNPDLRCYNEAEGYPWRRCPKEAGCQIARGCLPPMVEARWRKTRAGLARRSYTGRSLLHQGVVYATLPCPVLLNGITT